MWSGDIPPEFGFRGRFLLVRRNSRHVERSLNPQAQNGHLAKPKTLNRTSEPQPKFVIQIPCWRGPAEHRRFSPSSLRS